MAKRLLVTSTNKIEFQDFELDSADLRPNELAGEMLYSLISAGTEIAGNFCAVDRFPRTTGYAAVWRVTSVGAEVTDIRPGDVVFSLNGHQTHIRNTRANVHPLPAGLSPVIAPCARLMGVSMATLTRTPVPPPMRVLVTGLGPVGHLAAKIFSTCGYDVTAVDPSPQRREWLGSIGRVLAKVPMDEKPLFSLSIECSGHEQAILDACDATAKCGEVVLVGTPWRKQTDLSAHALAFRIFYKIITLRSGWEYELPEQPGELRIGSQQENFAAALRWLADGRVNVDGLTRLVSPLNAQSIYEQLMRNESPTLFTILDWQNKHG